MKKFFKWVGIIILVAVALPIAWLLIQDYLNSYSWHQKLTIVVETPSGLKTGSSVTSMRVGLTSFIPGQPGGRGTSRLRGEATIVEVAPGRYLFVLLNQQDNLAQRVFDDHTGQRSKTYKETFSRLSSLRETRTVPTGLIPLLVTFTNINDPTNVKRVYPDDLAASFGTGYELKTITLEITDKPITKGEVEKVLGWWNNLSTFIGGNIKRKYSDPFYGLGKSNFRR
ncbi:MAG: hypothetical protein COB78_01980 [Hyphomicrobiales bacterium]|nr:MAG: hypothetical protein COB78_01980 [Hyphomicrobiales bacterium]